MANVLNVNPTRMELLKLGKRLSLAVRGHRLLKDKQDELMDRFTELLKEVFRMREEMEDSYRELKFSYVETKYLSDHSAFYSYCLNPVIKSSILFRSDRLMNLAIPEIKVDFVEKIETVGNLNMASVFGSFLKRFLKVAESVIKLANVQKRMSMIAEELQKVRRRVNALEYIFIPKLQETIDYISMQLEEMERENTTRLMKIKEIVRKQK